MKNLSSTIAALSLSALAACGGSSTTSNPDMTSTTAADMTSASSPDMTGLPSSAQDPPTNGGAAVEAWLATGAYKAWHCEAAAHPARSPSPHGINRICNNLKIQTAPTGAAAGEYPVDSASVKELYDAAGANIIGYAVDRHISAGKTGDTWYWYERNPTLGGVVADGVGTATSGPPYTICVGCHQATGKDAAHSGHDFVYTQVP